MVIQRLLIYKSVIHWELMTAVFPSRTFSETHDAQRSVFQWQVCITKIQQYQFFCIILPFHSVFITYKGNTKIFPFIEGTV